MAQVALGEVGLILSIKWPRLARSTSDWYPLLDVCGHRGCLIADRDGVHDPGTPNSRLLLGLKGTISELELHTPFADSSPPGSWPRPNAASWPRACRSGLVPDPQRRRHEGSPPRGSRRITLVFDNFLQLHAADEGDAHAAGLRADVAAARLLQRDCRTRTSRWTADILKNPAYAAPSSMVEPPYAPRERRVKLTLQGTAAGVLMEDRGEGQISGLHQLRGLRESPGHAAGQPGRVRAPEEPWRPATAAHGSLHGITWCRNADTRWWSATRAAASMCATICISNMMRRCASACGPPRSRRSRRPSWRLSRRQKSNMEPSPAGSDPSRRCSARNRAEEQQVERLRFARRRWPSVSSTVWIPTAGWCSRWSSAGRLRWLRSDRREPREAAGHRHPEQ